MTQREKDKVGIEWERISYQDDPILYDLEELIHEAIEKVVEHRQKQYGESYDKAEGQTFLTLLDGHKIKLMREICQVYLDRFNK